MASHGLRDNSMYNFGFILSTLLGNNTRYDTLKKYSARETDINCTWAPVRHYYLPTETDPVAMLPGPLHTRAVVIAQAWPVLRRLRHFDAVMVHQFEVSSLLALGASAAGAPIIVNAHDNPPVIDPATYPLYPEQRDKAAWRSKLRLTNDLWAVRRAGYFLGFSPWSANIIERCGLDPSKVVAQHVGLDLEQWHTPPEKPATVKVKLLFVGGDFARKGGTKLLQIYAADLADRCTLDIVTGTELADLPTGCRVFHGMTPGSPELLNLFRQADILILPTEADLVPWVVLEAMACGCAVIASRIGGIPDLVSEDCGILFDPGDPTELRSALLSLTGDPDRRRAMGIAGRRRIETDFDAARNVPRIFRIMKQWVDDRRACHQGDGNRDRAA